MSTCIKCSKNAFVKTNSYQTLQPKLVNSFYSLDLHIYINMNHLVFSVRLNYFLKEKGS